MTRHNCRNHIVRRIPPKSASFTSGGKPEHICGVCQKPVSIVMRANEVLARIN